MWSPLGSSTMGSSTLRSSLSENSIPLLLYKNTKNDRKVDLPFLDDEYTTRRKSRSSTDSSTSSSGSSQAADPLTLEETDRPTPPPRRKRNVKKSNIPARTLTPGAEPGASRLLEKGRCVSMPSVVSTPVTPHHHLLPRQHIHLNQGKTTGSHHRRFHRRFPQVNNDEGLVDYYSCALVADILLQGILYVGDRHFAFYSNIFGLKKRLLIPAQNVIKVSKERTAKFIPNAVGIATAEHKFVFASLISRDATFKAMYEVWTRCNDMDFSLLEDSDIENTSPVPETPRVPEYSNGFPQHLSEDEDVEEEDSSPSEVGIPTLQTALPDRARCLPSGLVLASPMQEHKDSTDASPVDDIKVGELSPSLAAMPRTSLLLIASTLLLVTLFASATVLVYRIAVLQKQLHGVSASTGPDFRLFPETPAHRWKAYQELSRRQNKVLSEEVGRLTTRLQEHVRHLHQMRLPLEELAATASKMPDFCTQNPTVSSTRVKSQQPPQPSQAHRQSQPQTDQSQRATYAAA